MLKSVPPPPEPGEDSMVAIRRGPGAEAEEGEGEEGEEGDVSPPADYRHGAADWPGGRPPLQG